jgi:hypothetical protein
MAIEFKHRGRTWRADTVAEAIELRRQLDDTDEIDALKGGTEFDSEDADVWTPDTVTGMLENLGDAQLRFIRLLASDDRQITSKEIVQKLKLDSEVAFAGVLSGLSKQLKHIGLKPQQLYWVVVAWTGKTKTRSFALFDRFKAVANEIGWPDHWPAMKGAQNAASTKLPRK